MSVLNQSGEEQVECPLCMESLEVDDLNFFPCTCGYQVGRNFIFNLTLIRQFFQVSNRTSRRFADSAGTGFEQTRTASARPVARRIQKTRPTSSRCPRKSCPVSRRRSVKRISRGNRKRPRTANISRTLGLSRKTSYSSLGSRSGWRIPRKPTPSPPTVAAIKEGWPSLHQGSNGVDWHSVNGVHHIAGDTLGGHVQLPPDTWQSAFNFSHPPEDETVRVVLRISKGRAGEQTYHCVGSIPRSTTLTLTGCSILSSGPEFFQPVLSKWPTCCSRFLHLKTHELDPSHPLVNSSYQRHSSKDKIPDPRSKMELLNLMGDDSSSESVNIFREKQTEAVWTIAVGQCHLNIINYKFY
ncbi:unnamed protein product [Nesidiocoris tenuis]|uniref:Uncharacterized protein n=1 Tax=Nesidiocoris tenuis TaxID=355587 RepID=A0A6H5H8D7_9HEMI|nr:unnamed protein product [Nesidiocoris tenuis]